MLLTKLHIPPISENVVHRPYLSDKLNTGLNKKLILVSAPAGFGKTTVVSDWINENKIVTAWYSIDKSDNDPEEFLNYLISSIQSIHENFGLNTLALLKSPNKPSLQSIIVFLINEIVGIKNDFTLVLDDFHLIENNNIIEQFGFFIEHIPANIHVILITRSDPTLPIARLRSKNQLIEIRAADLSFSSTDISILFNKRIKISLTTEDIENLQKKTEGWIAGLQLTALSMQGRNNISDFIRELKGENRYIMDYLIEEVLKIQPESIKDFLIKTSILKQFSAPLCDSILQITTSSNIIEELEKNNMFIISLDDERKWYRYHHLFAELLKQRLYQTDNSLIGGLHCKAIKWYEKNNMIDFAIDHAIEVKDYHKVINLVSEVIESLWINGQHTSILKYGNLLPEEFIRDTPAVSLYYACVLVTSGQIQKAKSYLQNAEKIISEKIDCLENIDNNKKLLGKVCAAIAYLLTHEDFPKETLLYCTKASQYLKEEDHLWFIWVWYSNGVANYTLGNLQESTTAFQKAYNYGKQSGNILLLSNITVRMADIEQQTGHYTAAYNKCINLLALIKERGYESLAKNEWSFAGLYSTIGITHLMWAEFDKAFENIKLAYNLSRGSKDISSKTFILMSYLGVLYMQGEMKEAEIKEKEFEDIVKNNEISTYLNYYYITWKAYRYFELNQIEEALNLFEENGITSDGVKTPLNDSVYSMLVRLIIKQGKFDEAEKILAELMDLATLGQRIERLIDISMIYSTLFRLKGDTNKAIESMIQAMELASEENLLMYVIYNIDSSTELYKEIYKLQAAGKTKIPQSFIEKFKIALERQEKIKKAKPDSELSTRELDTLKLIAQDLSNQEIADKLFISLNTVKTHLKNIYLKLEVDSRTKAVARAKEQGII